MEEFPQYHYPKNRLDKRQLELAADLSSSHAVGIIQPLEVDPEKYPAMGAWRVDSKPIAPEDLERIAHDVYPPSDGVLEDLQTGRQAEKIHRIGELLTSKHSIINTIPHSSISDIGLAHGLPVIALRKLGYKFRSGMVVSQGVTMLGREYHGLMIPVPDYLGYMCDTSWYVYPKTDKTASSELVEEVSEEMLKEPNGLVKTDMLAQQGEGGWFITSAVNATSYIRGKNDEHLLAGITSGTIETVMEERTRVQKSIAEMMGREQPIFELCDEPLNIKTADEAHDLIGHGMAHDLQRAISGARVIYLDPRRGMRAENFQ